MTPVFTYVAHQPAQPEWKFENPQLLKVIAHVISQCEDSESVVHIKKCFLIDIINLCRESKENRRSAIFFNFFNSACFSLIEKCWKQKTLMESMKQKIEKKLIKILKRSRTNQTLKKKKKQRKTIEIFLKMYYKREINSKFIFIQKVLNFFIFVVSQNFISHDHRWNKKNWI